MIGLYQIPFGFVKNKAYLVHRFPLSVPLFFRIIPLDDLLKRLIISFRKVVHYFYFHYINMVAQKDRHISLTMISNILWDNLCIERSEKSIENRGIVTFEIGQVVIGEITPGDPAVTR